MQSDRCEGISDALPLERVFGNPVSKVLDFLILNQDFDYSESDISKLAEVPSRTLQRVLPCLLAEQLVKRTRKSSKANMYKADFDSKRVLALQQYIKATIEENLKNQEYFKDKKKSEKVIKETNDNLFGI